MQEMINITSEEALETLVFLEWLKSFIMIWKLKNTPIPFPKGKHEWQLDILIKKYKEVTQHGRTNSR